MKRFNSKRVILFLVVLTFLVTSICKISIFAATGNILAISEVVKTFDEGKLVKVKDGDIVKDVIVLNNGTIEDYDASKHSKYFKDSKISKVLKEKKDKLSDNAMISVSIWLTDIDMEKVEKTVKDKLSITDITKETDEKIQKFIEDKRAAAAIEYKIKNEKFYSKYVKAENILFTSSYAPYIVANVEKKVVDNLEKDNEVAYLDIFENSKKVEEVASSIPTVNANYTRDTKNLKGNGVKVGIVEMGYPDKTNSQLTGRSITFDIPDSQASSKISTHATRITSIIVGNSQGIVPNSNVYVVAALDRTQDYTKIEWLISQGVNVISYSSGYADNRGTYTYMAKWMDHLAYQHNLCFVKSAGNASGSNYGVTDPGMAYNIETVGSMKDNNTSGWSDDSFSSFSCYSETTGGYKPNLTAPGESIDVAGYTGNSGTSFSAPHVTGIVTQMCQLKSELKTKPAAMKSILSTGTTHRTATDYGGYSMCPNYSNKEGAGVVDAKGSYNTAYNNRYVQVLLTNNQFPYQRTYNVTSTSSPVRVSLAWLKQNTMSGDHATGTLTEMPLSDIDLYVYNPSNVLVGSSISSINNVEVVQFTPTVTGTYKIVVHGYSLKNSNEVIGLSWNQ